MMPLIKANLVVINCLVSFSFFSPFTVVSIFFKVRDVRMISDRNSRRSKGIAYIEFVDATSVPLAIGLTGQRVLGVPIIVQVSQVRASTHRKPTVCFLIQ